MNLRRPWLRNWKPSDLTTDPVGHARPNGLKHTISEMYWDLRERRHTNKHGLQFVGSVFRIGLGQYAGDTLTLHDGTVIKDGDEVGEGHLWNRYISTFHAESTMPGLQFRREVERSLQAVASLMVKDLRFHQIKAWRGTTWSTKGSVRFWTRLGFELKPIENPRMLKRLTVMYERMLRHYAGRTRRRPMTSCTFWITSRELLRRYGGEG